MSAVRLLMLACLVASLPAGLLIAADAKPAAAAIDPVKDDLDKARTERADARAAARADLLRAFDKQLRDASATANLDAMRALTGEKDAFTASGAVPASPVMKDAAAQYDQAKRQADAKLAQAFEVAIDTYTRQSKLAEGMEARRQRRLLLEGREDAPIPGTPATPAAVGAQLDQAKAQYGQSVADAKRALVAAIDARISTVTTAGDLNALKALEPLRAAADAGTPLPDEIADPTVAAAKARYGQAVQAANGRIAQAYQSAIREFTRTRMLNEAEATQAEYNATGLPATAGAAAVAPPAAGDTGAQSNVTYKLAANLPPLLVADHPYTPEKDGGIRPKDGTYIRSKTGTYLNKDFTFDVWFLQERKSDKGFIGIGEGIAKYHDPEASVMIRINPASEERGPVVLHKPNVRGDKGDTIVHLSEPGTYVARFEKRGNVLTVSVGTEKDGKFTADGSKTIANLHEYAPILNDKNTHLFFGSGMVFKQVRLVMGSGAAGAAAAGGGMPSVPVNVPGSNVGGGATSAPPAVAVPAPPSPAVPAPAAPAPGKKKKK